MSPRSCRTRAQRLAGRVRWLERWRRLTAILIAAVAGPSAVAAMLSAAQLEGHTGVYVALVPLLSAVTWWLGEAGLGLVAAVWETDLDAELRCELPRAQALPPRHGSVGPSQA